MESSDMTTPPINSFGTSDTDPLSGTVKGDNNYVVIGSRHLGTPADAFAMLRRQIVVCRARIEAAKQKPASASSLTDAERWLVELTRDLAYVQSLIASPPVSAPADTSDTSDTDPMTEEEEPEDEFVQLANLGQAPGQDRIYGEPKPAAEESSRPLTSDDLAAIMSAFQKTVSDALASQQADFDRRLASGLVPAQGKLVPGSDPRKADCFAAVADGKAETGSKKRAVVKSTVELPGPLRLRMKSMEIERKISGQKLIVAAVEDFLTRQGF
jgi:hypothetical protein